MTYQSTKKRLIKRLRWYYQVEGMNVVMFLGIMVFLNAQYGIANLLFLSYGLLLVCFILVQGTYYWWIKLSVLQDRENIQNNILSLFRSFKKQNLAAFAAVPFVLLFQWFISGKQFSGDSMLGWGAVAIIFAILEYINYYKKQLMYDNTHDINYILRNRKLKEASLYKDLRENKI